jgi:hypothetical protein
MAACATLAVAGAALLIGLGLTAVWHGSGLLAAAALLAGGARARRRLIASGLPTMEQPQ